MSMVALIGLFVLRVEIQKRGGSRPRAASRPRCFMCAASDWPGIGGDDDDFYILLADKRLGSRAGLNFAVHVLGERRGCLSGTC